MQAPTIRLLYLAIANHSGEDLKWLQSGDCMASHLQSVEHILSRRKIAELKCCTIMQPQAASATADSIFLGNSIRELMIR
jgi:hypothetical protein